MFLKIEDCSTVYLKTHKYRKDTNCRKMLSFVIIFYGMVLRALHLNALVFDDFSGMHFFFFFKFSSAAGASSHRATAVVFDM